MKQKPQTPDAQYNWQPGADPETEEQIEALFNSPEITQLKELMCDIGRRLWQREYTDGNGGNLTVRIGDNLVLCTPTMICKGFMAPEDMCLVDMDGKQLAGTRARTSEVLTHLGIMKRQPQAKACVHAHPPTATGFAIAGVAPPRWLTPESEVFLGEVGVARYCRPGSQDNSDVIGEVGTDHVAVLMSNHGVITRGFHLEMAYWRMENLETHCKTTLAARQVVAAKGNNDDLPQISGGDAEALAAAYDYITARM